MIGLKENKLFRAKSEELLKRSSPHLFKLKSLYPTDGCKLALQNSRNETSQPLSLSPTQCTEKRKNFFEMIGLKDIRDKRPDGLISDLKTNSRRISIIDFMGKNKMNFLKRTGFLEYFEEYERGKGFQKLLELKQTVSVPNIKHSDKMREYMIKSPGSSSDNKINLLFKKEKFKKNERKKRIDTIEKIIIKCDDLYQKSSHSKESFSKLLIKNKEIQIKKKLKISLHDINMIKKHMK
jgi:hypothetical protein